MLLVRNGVYTKEEFLGDGKNCESRDEKKERRC